MKNLMRMMLVVALVLACVSSAACDNEKEEEAVQAAPTAGETADAMAEATEKPAVAATSKSKESATPAFPGEGRFTWDDMPVYPGAEDDEDALNIGAGSSGDSTRMEWRVYKTNDSFDKVVDFYKKEMPENGWEKVRWADVEMTEANWTTEEGMYQKNDWYDTGVVTITDKGEGAVQISLMRASGEEEEDSSAAEATSGEGEISSGEGFTFDDMPIYPGSDTDERTWITISKDDFKSEKRTYETSDSLDQVAEFYKSEMLKNGWDQVMWSQTGEMVNGLFGKGNDEHIGQVVAVKEGDKVIIALQRTYEKG